MIKAIDSEGNFRERMLGFTVVKGNQVAMVSPAAGIEEVTNPFSLQE